MPSINWEMVILDGNALGLRMSDGVIPSLV